MVYYINEPWSGQLNLFSYYDFQKVDRATRSRDDPFVNCLPLKGPLRPKDSYDSLLYGPSCHPHDRYNGTPSLPLLNVGDKIRFQAHGAYSVSDGTRFNGFQMPKVFYTIKPEYEHLLK
ncbi:Ornithine decarboxylase [Halotydeus destructor]|nr:Ornithine decarboxylase [Halotydeus destructor]